MKISIPPLLLVALVATVSQNCPAAPPAKPAPVQVEEKSSEFYGKKSRAIAPDAFRERVDYQSELAITVNTNGLLESIGQIPSVLASLTAEERTHLDKFSAMLQSARVYLRNADELVDALEAHKGKALTTNAVTEIKALIRRRGESGLKVMEPLIDYVDAKIQRENPTASSRMRLELRKPYEDKFLGGKLLDLPSLTAFVNTERGALISQALQDTRQVRSAGSVHLRMRSSVLRPGQSPVRLHVRNYDSLDDADVAQEPRISFKMSEEDRQRITAQVKAIGEAVKLAEDLKNRKSEMRQALDELLPGLRGDLQSWKEAVGPLDDLKRSLGNMAAALEKAGGTGELSAEVKNTIQQAHQIFTNTAAKVQRVRDNVSRFTDKSNPATDPASVLIGTGEAVANGLLELLDDFRTITTAITETIGTAGEVAKKITDDMLSRDAARLQDLVDAFKPAVAGALPRTAEAITNLLATTVQRYPTLVGMLSKLARDASVSVAALNLPPVQDDPNLLDVGVFNPPNGAINLARNIARGDVTVTLDAVIFTRNEKGESSGMTSIHHQEFSVQKFGLINTWSANLIFVKRLGDLGPTERKVQFTPAPSISWTMHYNPPPRLESDTGPNKFWQTLNPGVGLNVSTLTFRDNGVQIGVGAHVTLFRDLLIAGAGYNLNESYHGSYVFLGLSIFEGLSQLGLNIPVGK